MEAIDKLETWLQKKWLSANSVRDGLIASATLALLDLSRQGLVSGPPGPVDEAQAYERALQASREAFKSLGIDEEYPAKDQLERVKVLMEERLGFDKLPQEAAEPLARHRERADRLLEKFQ